MKITVKESKKNEAHDFHHITEDERKAAQDLWNKFNADLEQKGMKLYYDYDNGSFFVASTDLKNGYMDRDGTGDTSADLDEQELEAVIYEGGFDEKAVNNPPWFTSMRSYGLRTKSV